MLVRTPLTSTTDFSSLGRLGTADGRPPRRRGSRGTSRPGPRRGPLGGTRSLRRRLPSALGALPLPQLVAGVVVLAVVALWTLGSVVGSQTSVLSAVTVATPEVDPELQAALLAGDGQTVATGTVTLMPGGGAAAGSVSAPPAFAAVEDVALHLPISGGGGVVFSEADVAEALPLAPVGEMTTNANPDGYAPDQVFPGPEYAVADPATGVRPATGMAAVLAAPGTTLTAPVQGTVASVMSSPAADGGQDWHITIAPEGRDDLHVVVRRIDLPLVSQGDHVTVGTTEIGTVRPGAVVHGERVNPLSLPSALIHVQPALSSAGVDPAAPASPVAAGSR